MNVNNCSGVSLPRTVAAKAWAWADLGNHRALVRVVQPADAVLARIEWRRRDRYPERIGVRVFELDSGREVLNVLPGQMTRVAGEVVFAAPVAGRYAIYFMPFAIGGKYMWTPHVQYRPADYADRDPAWAERAAAPGLPESEVEEIQARTAVDAFTDMELIAGEDETVALLARHPGEAFLLFPEDRTRPIRMTDDLPYRWVQTGPQHTFCGQARPNEYYALQVGVFAVEPLTHLQVTCGELCSDTGDVIPAAAVTCFNTGGTDWLGRPFAKDVTVAAGQVQPLWFGIDLPCTANGVYRGTVRVTSGQATARELCLEIKVGGKPLADRGDAELWRMSRLRWLNSTIGLDDEPAGGYSALRVRRQAVSCQGRRVDFGGSGLPQRIRSYFDVVPDRLVTRGTDVLTRPVALVTTSSAGERLEWQSGACRIEQAAPGKAVVTAASSGGALRLETRTEMEFDGHLDCRLKLIATADCDLADLALEIPLRRDVAIYMMGMGRKGGYRPASWHYDWNIDRSNHHCWLGTVNAGLHLKLKHDADVWNLVNLRASGFPAGWHNSGRGGCDIAENGTDEVLLRAYCGPRELKTGEVVSLRFALLLTPLKKLDVQAHWGQRYHHIDCWDGSKPSIEEAARVGATVVNLHQGGKLNPYINYPFLFMDEMKAEAEAAHAAGLKYKLYYTLRELSHMTAEIWAFRSLNGEVYQERGKAMIADQFAEDQKKDLVAGGTGGPWLVEHLRDRYVPAWQQRLPDGEMDQSIATTGLSRLHNHHLEGLGWLIKALGLDGIYLDGVGYDREIMKRVRKAMDRTRPGCLIDFHSGNNFAPEYGLNNVLSMYLELLPFVDSLWIGEGFDYNASPDYYMTEICGIPFGLMNDMLQGGGNPWRGMVYGMTCRYGWQQGGDPQHIWRLWKAFGIAEARMVGYWVPNCPVKTDHPDVLATAYVRPDGRTLVALASWAPEPVSCRLRCNWRKLGLKARDAHLTAPAIPGFQDAAEFASAGTIPVALGRGWLLELHGVGSREEIPGAD